jgi:hypothetical protein
MDRRQFLRTALYGGTIAALVGAGILSSEYTDLPGFDDKIQAGRTKNSIAAVVAGIVGQKLYGNSNIDLEIQKSLFPDARVTGNTTPNSVDTYVNLALTSTHFVGQNNSSGQLEGEVDKSEFNWKVKQTSEDKYEIARWGPKFDGALELTVKDGKISGTYIRGGPHFNWKVNGTYDNLGHVKYEIDGPLNLGITLDGKITPK